ncbi:MAG: YheT family hydrolase [Candidatus Acidiferrales bacterium]
MTIASSFWPRKFPNLPRAEERLFEVEPETRILAHCHWQDSPHRHATLLLVHGLEGSSDSGYMLGTAEKAFRQGFNVLRMNQRNCGGTEQLTSTLYNSGLSRDYKSVVEELIARDRLPEIFAAGYSMGGNLVLKMAGEWSDHAPAELRGIAAVSPSLDLAACAGALNRPQNRIYQRHFVNKLKQRMQRKAKLYPGLYPLDGLNRVRSVWDFDDVITARFCGFRDAADYYQRSSALRVIAGIRVPTLIVTAQDDPMIPYPPFLDPALQSNPNITLVAPRHGGHCGFITRQNEGGRFWSEECIVEFCQAHAKQGAVSTARSAKGID